MTSLAARIIGAAAAAIILTVATLYVFQIGPFNPRPSVAAKALPKVQATVAKTQAAETKAVDTAETKTQTAAAIIEKRTDDHVAKIRQSTARAQTVAVPADVPDAEFYRGVCASKLYAGTADCRGFGGKP